MVEGGGRKGQEGQHFVKLASAFEYGTLSDNNLAGDDGSFTVAVHELCDVAGRVLVAFRGAVLT